MSLILQQVIYFNDSEAEDFAARELSVLGRYKAVEQRV
jgi:hypothetical protein